MQMELEAENLWSQSIGYDFDGKTKFIKKYYFFLVENCVAEKKSKKFQKKNQTPYVRQV